MATTERPNRTRHRVQSSERTFKVLDLVIAHPGKTVRQLTRLLGELAEATVREHLKVLTTSGRVRHKHGLYYPPTVVGAGRSGPTGKDLLGLHAILEHLAAHPEGLTGPELAAMPDLNPELVNGAICAGLEADWFFRDADERYHLNPDRPPSSFGTASHEDISTLLKNFTQASGRDVALATLWDGKLVLTHMHLAPKRPSLLVDIPPDAAHGTAGGHALLHQRTEAQRRRFLTHAGMPAYTSLTPTTYEALAPLLPPDPAGIYDAPGRFCAAGACLAILVRHTPERGGSIAITTSVYRADLGEDQEKQRKMRELRANLIATAGLLAPRIGPLPLDVLRKGLAAMPPPRTKEPRRHKIYKLDF